MKILVGIPVVTGLRHTKDSIDSVLNQLDVDCLIIDNNATEDLKGLFELHKTNPNFHIIINKENIFVNPAWNQIIHFFLLGNYSHLIIMNSDLTLQKDWSEVLKFRFLNTQNETVTPFILNDVNHISRNVEIQNLDSKKINGAAGVFISLNRDQAKAVYPIPDGIKVWFGDNWIYNILKDLGNEIVVPENLLAFHGVSQTIQNIKDVAKVIEEDKKNWELVKLEIPIKIKEWAN